MALSIVEVLERHGAIEQDLLARLFAAKYLAQPDRGYGGSARGLLEAIAAGMDWRVASPSLFSGQGSSGNGAAMRAAPIGAFFADDLDHVVEQSLRSAEVTHSHEDAQAGAIAVALAAAHVCRDLRGWPLLEAIVATTPDSETRQGIKKALDLRLLSDARSAVSILGNGSGLLSRDTVPFCLWCLAQAGDSFESALWLAVSGLGDRDTTCAIVGGISALAVSADGLPSAWIARRESLTTLAGI
jgi:ADP-ribosylglycohydrolase